jgi:hypothetical protein
MDERLPEGPAMISSGSHTLGIGSRLAGIIINPMT